MIVMHNLPFLTVGNRVYGYIAHRTTSIGYGLTYSLYFLSTRYPIEINCMSFRHMSRGDIRHCRFCFEDIYQYPISNTSIPCTCLLQEAQ